MKRGYLVSQEKSLFLIVTKLYNFRIKLIDFAARQRLCTNHAGRDSK